MGPRAGRQWPGRLGARPVPHFRRVVRPATQQERISPHACATYRSTAEHAGCQRLSQLDPLAATRARLERVERALAKWDAYDAGQGPEPQGLSRVWLEDLRGLLVQALAEKQAAARLDLLRRWNKTVVCSTQATREGMAAA